MSPSFFPFLTHPVKFKWPHPLFLQPVRLIHPLRKLSLIRRKTIARKRHRRERRSRGKGEIASKEKAHEYIYKRCAATPYMPSITPTIFKEVDRAPIGAEASFRSSLKPRLHEAYTRSCPSWWWLVPPFIVLFLSPSHPNNTRRYNRALYLLAAAAAAAATPPSGGLSL